MGTTKRTTRKFKMTPVDSIPEAANGGNRGPAAHWVEIAEQCKANPGVPYIVRFDDMSPKGHQSAASGINAASRNSQSKTGKNRAFAEPGYTAAYRDGVLYVRYDAPAKVTQIQRRGRRGAA